MRPEDFKKYLRLRAAVVEILDNTPDDDVVDTLFEQFVIEFPRTPTETETTMPPVKLGTITAVNPNEYPNPTIYYPPGIRDIK